MSASEPAPHQLDAPEKTALSEREIEILRLVATGLSNKEIAAQLTISPNTVKVHLRNIFGKIDVASRTEATVYAIRHGLVQVPGGPGASGPAAGPAAPQGGLAQLARRYWPALALALVALGALVAWFGPRLLAPAPPTPEVSGPPRWQERAEMPTARSGLAVAAYDNRLYAIAGDTGQGVTGAVERYDPEADSWETGLAAKPAPVADVSAAVIGGRIFVPGGRLADGAVSDLLEVYDPREDSWTGRAPLPAALSAYALAAFEGKLYVFGGWDGADYVATVYEYDPDEDAWTERTPMPTARGYAGAAVAGGRVYVVGGRDAGGALAANEEYSPQDEAAGADPWQARADLPAGRYGAGVASVADIIHVVGGEGETAPVVSLKFLPTQGEWQVFEFPIQEPTSETGITVIGNELHIIGGASEALPTAQHETYQAVFTVLLPVVQ